MRLALSLPLPLALLVAIATASPGLAADIHLDSSKQSPTPETRHSVFISAAQVLCVAQQGIQPSGKPVPAKGKRPAGVAVYGVSTLGFNVRDGDVVTEIMGQPVRSVTQGIAMILAARAAKRSSITGTAWRALRPYSVTVEQPYTMPDCSADDSDCWKSQCAKDRRSKVKPRAQAGQGTKR